MVGLNLCLLFQIPEKTVIQNMENSTAGRFMQPLIHGFLNAFSIPVSFLKHLEKELEGQPLKSVVLMTESGRRWDVKIEGGYHFKDGWQEFCVYHQLRVGDFLVFIHQTHFLFHVEVFDPTTACQRLYFPSSHRNGTKKRRGLKINSTSKRKPLKANDNNATATATHKPSVESQSPCGHIILSPYNIRRKIIYLPLHFSRSNGLENINCDITLVDGKERRWKVRMSSRRSNGQNHIVGGWTSFQAANNLKPGDKLSFQLLEAGKRPILKCYRLCSGCNSDFTKEDI